MSAPELDLPVRVTPEGVRRRSFAKVRRGFDPDQVRDYLHQVADELKRLENEVREARLEAEAAYRTGTASRPHPYQQLAERLADLLQAADLQAERLRREAEDEAAQVLADARAEADSLRLEARATAEEALALRERSITELEQEAERALADVASRRDSLVEHLKELRESLLGIAGELDPAGDVAAVSRARSH